MKKIIILLVLPFLLIGCGDGDGDGNNNSTTYDPNEPMIGSWQQFSEERYFFEEERNYGRTCLGELDPELPSKIFAYSNGKLDMYFYECSGGDEFSPVRSQELFSLGGNWEQIGSQGNYLFFDPAEEEPNEEITYFEFSSDNSRFTHDTGEVIQIWKRQ